MQGFFSHFPRLSHERVGLLLLVQKLVELGPFSLCFFFLLLSPRLMRCAMRSAGLASEPYAGGWSWLSLAQLEGLLLLDSALHRCV